MHRIAALGLAATLAVTLTGCDKSTYTCNMGTCEVSVSGSPTVNLGPDKDDDSDPGNNNEPANPEEAFDVVGYAANAVTVQSIGNTKTIQAGRSAQVGELQIKVLSVSGESAKLQVKQ